MYFPEGIWFNITSFMMHNIKRHGKHLKDDVHIKNYSNCISIFKDSLRKVNDVTVIYNSKVRYSVIDNKKVYFYKIMYDLLINHNTNKIREIGIFRDERNTDTSIDSDYYLETKAN